MIKFDCGRAPGLEKRLRREPDEADRTEGKVGGVGLGSSVLIWVPAARPCRGWGGFPRRGCLCPVSLLRAEGQHHTGTWLLPPLQVTCSPRERPSHRPTPELKIKTKSYRRESILNSSPNTGPKRTPERPGSAEGPSVFPCRECERYRPFPEALHANRCLPPSPRGQPLPRSDPASGDSAGCSIRLRVEMPT